MLPNWRFNTDKNAPHFCRLTWALGNSSRKITFTCMRKIIYFILFCALTGCATSNHLTNAREVGIGDHTLKFERRGSGIGSCGYVSNAIWSSSEATLLGDRSEYKTGEFVIGSFGRSMPSTGYIKIDKRRKRVEVNVELDGKPYEFNGKYEITE